MQPTINKAPMSVLIIAWIMFFASVGPLLMTLTYSPRSFFQLNYIISNLLPGILIIFCWYGLRNMKRWSLYLFLAMATFLIVIYLFQVYAVYIVNSYDGWNELSKLYLNIMGLIIILPVFITAVLLWSKRKLFS